MSTAQPMEPPSRDSPSEGSYGVNEYSSARAPSQGNGAHDAYAMPAAYDEQPQYPSPPHSSGTSPGAAPQPYGAAMRAQAAAAYQQPMSQPMPQPMTQPQQPHYQPPPQMQRGAGVGSPGPQGGLARPPYNYDQPSGGYPAEGGYYPAPQGYQPGVPQPGVPQPVQPVPSEALVMEGRGTPPMVSPAGPQRGGGVLGQPLVGRPSSGGYSNARRGSGRGRGGVNGTPPQAEIPPQYRVPQQEGGEGYGRQPQVQPQVQPQPQAVVTQPFAVQGVRTGNYATVGPGASGATTTPLGPSSAPAAQNAPPAPPANATGAANRPAPGQPIRIGLQQAPLSVRVGGSSAPVGSQSLEESQNNSFAQGAPSNLNSPLPGRTWEQESAHWQAELRDDPDIQRLAERLEPHQPPRSGLLHTLFYLSQQKALTHGDPPLFREEPLAGVLPPGSRVAVDGDLFLANCLRALHEEEPMWFLVAPCPPQLLDIVRNAASALFQSQGLVPIFVFSGTPARGGGATQARVSAEVHDQQDAVWERCHELRTERLTRVRELFAQGQALSEDQDVPVFAEVTAGDRELAMAAFGVETEQMIPPGEDVERRVEACLRELGFEVIHAPFSQWAQMVALTLPVGPGGATVADAVFGPAELVLFAGCSRVYLAIEDSRADNGGVTALYLNRGDVKDTLYMPYIRSYAAGSACMEGATQEERELYEADVRAAQLAQGLSPAHVEEAFVHFGLLASTADAFVCFRTDFPADSELFGVPAAKLVQRFRQHTVAPDTTVADFGPVPAARYNLAQFLHKTLAVPSQQSEQDMGRFLVLTRQRKWRVLRGAAFVRTAFVFAPLLSATQLVELSAAVKGALPPAIANGGAEATVSNDLTNVFGHRLPMAVHFFAMHGALHRSVAATAAHGYVKHDRPVADSKAYHDSVEKGARLTAHALYQLISQHLSLDSRYPQMRGYYWQRWNSPGYSFIATVRLDAALEEWALPDDVPRGTVARVASAAASAPDLDGLGVADVVSLAVNSTTDQGAYRTPAQVVAAAHLKLMDLLGYFTHRDCETIQGVYAQALRTAAEKQRVPGGAQHGRHLTDVPSALPLRGDALLLLIELLRTGSLTATPMLYITGAHYDQRRPAPVPEQLPPNRMHIAFAARVCCLCHVNTFGVWTAHPDRDVAAFGCIARNLQCALRNLTEVLAVELALNGTFKGSLDAYRFVPAALDFGIPVSTVGGVLAHFLLESPDDFGVNARTAEQRAAYVLAVFPCLAEPAHQRAPTKAAPREALLSVQATLRGLFDFWEAAAEIIELVTRQPRDGDETLERELAAEHEATVAASRLMCQKRVLFGV